MGSLQGDMLILEEGIQIGLSLRPWGLMILELEAKMENINGNLCWMINSPGWTSGLDG